MDIIPKVLAHCSYIGTGGYNQHSRDFFRHLSKLVDVKVRNFTIGNSWDGMQDEPHNKEEYINDTDKKLLLLQSLWKDQSKGLLDSSIIYSKYENNFKKNINIILSETNHHYFYHNYIGPKIGYNVWESTLQPEEFFNKWKKFDQLWVPSKWQAQCTIDQGVDPNKVKVVPEGVDITTFYPDEINHKDYDDGRFKFILFGRWDYRKSTKEIIEAFLKTFSSDEPIDLILSIDNKWGDRIDGFTTTEERLKYWKLNDDRLKIKHFPSREDYIKYIKKGHVFLSCSRSEGWNLPLIEAMACGTPSIYSNCSAQLEFAEGKGLPVNIIGERIATYQEDSKYTMAVTTSQVPGNYYEPDFDDLSKVMRDAYKNYDKHKTKALKDAKIIHKDFNWDKVAEIGRDTLVDFMKNYKEPEDNNKIITSFIPSPKIEIKGDYNKSYEVEFIDSNTKKIIFCDVINNGMWSSIPNKFDSLAIKVNGKIIDVMSNRLNEKIYSSNEILKSNTHLVDLHSNSLGDTIAIMPYLDLYAQKNAVKLYLRCNDTFNNLFTNSYPNIKLTSTTGDDFDRYFDKIIHIIHDFSKPLQQGMAEQLGFKDYSYIRPKIDSFKTNRPLKNKYVTFGIHSTLQMKYWNHPNGKEVQGESPNWNELSKMFRKSNLTPVCLELHEEYGVSPYFNTLPNKSVNKIGMSLEEVVNYIEHSEFYIGLSSGMAWVAHALGKPVAMIANFTEDWNEMGLNEDDYIRITNKDVCHGCWHTENININDWDNCPKHQNTNRQFECHTSITPKQVFNKIKKWI
jgi:autotransporter strand-loop-strand O-heptosyltransferase